VGCETIFAFIYPSAQQAEQLWRYLTRRHKRRRPRRSRPSQDTIKDRVSIRDRPENVAARTEAVIGKVISSFVLVLHECKSRVTLAARLAGKTAAETISVMLAVSLGSNRRCASPSLSTMKPPSPSTPCVRRWLPRQIDIDKVSDQEIQYIVITANLTPRKCLGFKTPFQAILKELGKDVQIRFT